MGFVLVAIGLLALAGVAFVDVGLVGEQSRTDCAAGLRSHPGLATTATLPKLEAAARAVRPSALPYADRDRLRTFSGLGRQASWALSRRWRCGDQQPADWKWDLEPRFEYPVLRLLPSELPRAFLALAPGEQAWRGRPFLMSWAIGASEPYGWSIALSETPDLDGETEAIVRATPDPRIIEAVAARRAEPERFGLRPVREVRRANGLEAEVTSESAVCSLTG